MPFKGERLMYRKYQFFLRRLLRILQTTLYSLLSRILFKYIHNLMRFCLCDRVLFGLELDGMTHGIMGEEITMSSDLGIRSESS
jgi:hypothetical protein